MCFVLLWLPTCSSLLCVPVWVFIHCIYEQLKVVYWSFFSCHFLTKSHAWGHWTDLSQTWTHIRLWLLIKKFGPNSPWHLPHGLGQKTLIWEKLGIDFKLWLKISLRRYKKKSTIGKKLVNLQGLPDMPPKFIERWSRNGWEWLASFCPPPKYRIGDCLTV